MWLSATTTSSVRQKAAAACDKYEARMIIPPEEGDTGISRNAEDLKRLLAPPLDGSGSVREFKQPPDMADQGWLPSGR